MAAAYDGHRMVALPFTRAILLLGSLYAVCIWLQSGLDGSWLEIGEPRISWQATTQPDQLFVEHLPKAFHTPRIQPGQQPLAKDHAPDSCFVGTHPINMPRKYATPTSHPAPLIGSLSLHQAHTCTTYEERYGSYSDEMLGQLYLQGYPQTRQVNGQSQSTKQVDADQTAAFPLQLEVANDGAERTGQFLDWADVIRSCHQSTTTKPKQAIVLRAYEDYEWGRDDISNVRALISELALRPKEDRRYDVHILLEVHNRDVSISMSHRQRRAILRKSVPREFWGITSLWNEGQMGVLYPGLPGKLLNHMSSVNSYRSCFMPLQKLAWDHREYDYIWNWEMDTRSTDDYGAMLDQFESYARHAPVDALLERQSEWWIPARSETLQTTNDSEADLITLNPIFAVDGTGWYWEYDFQNLPPKTQKRASMGKNVRLSRRLLMAMNDANADEKSSTHCESFPATILVQMQQRQEPRRSSKDNEPAFKGVYVPHPIFTRHQWPPERLAAAVNRSDIYKKVNEKVLRDVSFYYDGGHAMDIYGAWREDSTVCRTPVLLHPVKRQR